MEKFVFKHFFVVASIAGTVLVGSINTHFRIWGFLLGLIGNIYWIWYHQNVTLDKEMLWVFIAYLVINSLAIVNNYYSNGLILW